MSNGNGNNNDPLNKYENIESSPLGDYLIRRERNTVRNFMPPNHPNSETGTQFAREMSEFGTNETNEVFSYNDVNELPPVHVLLRGKEYQNDKDLRSTIQHQLQEQKNEIRRRMNNEISAKKSHYDELSKKKHTPSNDLNRNRSIIEEKIKQKSGNGHGQNADINLVGSYPEITPVEEDTIENFTSPGEILGQQEDLLYSNKFDSTRVLKHDHSREFKKNFRRYFEEKREQEERLDKIPASNNDPLKTNNLNFALPSSSKDPGDSAGNQLTNPHENDRYNKPRQTLVSIDSKDRDVVRYPNANSFKISLGRQFRNVKRVVLLSTEFPNTDQIIREDPREAAFERNRILLRCGEVLNDANNHLYWINDEDAVVLNPSNPSENPYDCIFYTADLDPGNYKAVACECDEATLGEAIEEKVNNINRFQSGTPHQFIVDIDPQTNIVRFLSVESVGLAIDPITTAVGTNIVSVSQPGHSFNVGDNVTITGSTGVGGITATTLNQEHIIQSTTTDTYTIRVTQIANATTSGGGANVFSGQNKPMKLLFSNIDSIGRILGFPQQDSSEQIGNDIDFIDIDPPDLSVTPIDEDPGMPGTVPARIRSINHGLVPGDEILVLNTDTIPNINGVQRVTEVITENEFEIGIPIKVVNNQTVTDNTVLGTICRSLDTTFTEITSLTTRIDGNIQTVTPHNFDENDLVFFGNVVDGITTLQNPINGIQTVSANLSSDVFQIADGVSFKGSDISNAYVFETTSTSVNEITALIPQNNGVIEPALTEPIFSGTQVPDFVFFRRMGNISPELNGDIAGIFNVDYYSESTGRFDLTTPINNVFSQTSGQEYIRSLDPNLKTISDAFLQSNGTFRLNIPHGLATGNRIYVRSLIPDITTSTPRIDPDITGLLSINSILNTQNFDTTTRILSSVFDTGDLAYIPTDDKTTTRIQNIYPMSNNYLAKDIDNCKNPNCVMCEDSPLIFKDSYLRIASTGNAMAAIAEETSATTLINGQRTTNNVFSGQSKNFTHIFDITDVVLDVLPIPVERVTTPINAPNQTHTITMFYDFSSIMLNDPTTGTIVFGGTQQLELVPGVEYTFSYSPATETTSQIRITTLLDTTFTGSINSGALAPGTFYIQSITFDDPNSYRSPLGNCFVVQTGGVSPGTNGTSAIGVPFDESGGVIEVTTPFAHGLQTGDIIFIQAENVNDPGTPSGSNPWLIDEIIGTSQFPTFTFNFPGHNVDIAVINAGFGATQPFFRVNGNIAGPQSIFNGGTLVNNFYRGNPPPSLIYPTNTLSANEDIPPFGVIDLFGPQNGRSGVTLLDTNPGGGDGAFIWSFTTKDASFLVNTTQVVNVTGLETFEIILSDLIGSGYTGTIDYIAVCGGELPILSYFGNSWSGLFESQRHSLSSTVTSNVYIGKAIQAGTTTFPIDEFAVPEPINGYLGNVIGTLNPSHPFESPLNFNFFTSTDLFDTPIVEEEINAVTAEFVNVSGNNEVLSEIVEVTPANSGIIETVLPHGFVGGERLYFLGNVNINNGVTNDLRDSFFQITSIDPTDDRRFTIDVPLTLIGNGNVGAIAQGNFFRTPPNEVAHSIVNINRSTNGVFFCGPNHGIDSVIPSQVFITNNTLSPTFDVFGNAIAFPNPAPIPSNSQFDTLDIIVPASSFGTPLSNNKVDIVSTSNPLFPQISGMSWVFAPTSQKILIDDIFRDSNGTFSPVSPSLSIGDTIFIKSLQSTNQDINGFFTVSYIDLSSSSFFEVNDLVITDTGGTIDSGNIVYFRAPNANACVTINDITQGQCPTTIRAAEHGFPLDSNISVFICDTQTDGPIDYANVNIINDVVVKDNDEVILPIMGGTPTSNLCVDTVFNATNLFINRQGMFSKEILSTNCGEAILTPDPINHQTIVTTDSRKNLKNRVMFNILSSTPSGAGSSTIEVELTPEFTELPWTNGDIIQISGHIGGNPYIDGEYKAFSVGTNTFKIITRPATTFASIGGTGGFATGPAPSTIPGHGLITGDRIRFEEMTTSPSINGEIFDVTVITANTFTIPFVVEDVNNRCPGFWCSNVVDMEIRDHGLVDGDTFFLYNAQSVGGIQPAQLNTVHGDKRMNIPTQQERDTQKTVRVIDGNNIQFSVDSFPSARTLSGGFIVCISSNNHTNDEKAMGLKNYGFNAIQTNQDCLGKSRRFIDLNNERYVLMVSDTLNHLLNTGPVSKIFAKIQLNVEPNSVAFNSFVTTERLFDSPITRLDEIDLEIRRSDGRLFDLRGRDYSFSLLIEEYQDRLRNTEISSRRGIADRGLVSQAGFIESTISAENPDKNILNPAQFLASTDLTQRAKVATGFNT